MASIYFSLREPNATKRQSIICNIKVDATDRTRLSTGFYVVPKNWNKDKYRVKDVIAEKDKTIINKALQSIEEEFNRIMLRMTADKKAVNSAFLKSQLEEFLKPQQPETVPVPKETPTQELLRLIDQYITDSENGTRKNHDGEKLAYRSIQRYRTVQTRLVEYSRIYDRELSLATIDEVFHNDYVRWLEIYKNLAKNTIWKDVTTIKSIMNYFLEEGLIKSLPYRTKKFKAVEEESDSIYLTMAELEKIENLDLSNNQRLERVRDFFVVGCYTGFRYSDLSKVNKYSFLKEEDGTEFIQLVQQKTGEPVAVPVLHVVKEIFEKYSYQLPSISNQKVNDYIKEVCQMAKINETVSKSITKGGQKIITNYEKWQLVTDHTARRSFATNAFKRGVSTLVIMAITGHKTEKSFMKYIKLDNIEKAKRFVSDWLKFNDAPETQKVNIKVLTA